MCDTSNIIQADFRSKEGALFTIKFNHFTEYYLANMVNGKCEGDKIGDTYYLDNISSDELAILKILHEDGELKLPICIQQNMSFKNFCQMYEGKKIFIGEMLDKYFSGLPSIDVIFLFYIANVNKLFHKFVLFENITVSILNNGIWKVFVNSNDLEDYKLLSIVINGLGINYNILFRGIKKCKRKNIVKKSKKHRKPVHKYEDYEEYEEYKEYEEYEEYEDDFIAGDYEDDDKMRSYCDSFESESYELCIPNLGNLH